MYSKMFYASEKVLTLILTVQQEYEELFIVDFSPELKVISFSPKEGETTDGERTIASCKTLRPTKNNIRLTMFEACLDPPGKLLHAWRF